MDLERGLVHKLSNIKDFSEAGECEDLMDSSKEVTKRIQDNGTNRPVYSVHISSLSLGNFSGLASWKKRD